MAEPTGREPPHSLELERAVLGTLLDGRQATAVHTARAALEHPMVFFHRPHRMIYTACLDLDDRGERIEVRAVADLLGRYPLVAMVDRLSAYERLEDIDGLGRDRLRGYGRRAGDDQLAGDSALAAAGGWAYLAELPAESTPTSLGRACGMLRDHYQKRRFIDRLTRLVDEVRQTPKGFKDVLGDAGQAILDLGRLDRDAQVHAAANVAVETEEWLQRRQTEPESGVATGIAPIDERLRHLRPGGLYVLAARPGVGKTSLALKILSHACTHGTHALMVSLEVDRVDLLKKMLAAEAHVDFGKIESASLDEAEAERVQQALDGFKQWPLDFIDVSDLTVQGLRSLAKRRHAETGGSLGLVVLDYLQLLSSTRPDASEFEKISDITRVLKILARDLKLPILALSQMNRESEKGTGAREPKLSDLRGSGSIEQDADAVFFIHRVEDGGDEAPGHDRDNARKIKIILAKNRFGPTGGADMLFFPATMRFTLAATPHQQEHREAEDQKTPPRKPHHAPPAEDEDMF